MSTAAPALAVVHTAVFAAVPAQVGSARAWAVTTSGLPDDAAADLALITSELATNACRHSCSARPGGAYTLTLTRHEDRVRITVTDAGPRAVGAGRRPQPATGAEESGRGLALVAAFAHAWGVDNDTGGTRVWAEVRTAPDAGA
ncbi:anti-sigma regulatory factor (Ser/Thr protein kinase) [Murinocardiopsis flavida]|uniref:Anti-sigma regulatory factor (Ser/Thr protein kinase) n=1 Tax=Murinocardiopsis flavida TaxID=645275 RepID=A0A2P8CVD7_9ACTN|nr:ATP-binding protein [Murinocardiopsis flavida]PSK88944.1 anti-sigma regulatory factor (Ser/Thr protein kinase) [Murinocardiopsis flavida]